MDCCQKRVRFTDDLVGAVQPAQLELIEEGVLLFTVRRINIEPFQRQQQRLVIRFLANVFLPPSLAVLVYCPSDDRSELEPRASTCPTKTCPFDDLRPGTVRCLTIRVFTGAPPFGASSAMSHTCRGREQPAPNTQHPPPDTGRPYGCRLNKVTRWRAEPLAPLLSVTTSSNT